MKRLLIEEGCQIVKEYYIGLVVDRTSGRVVMMASEEGGTEIEEVAATHPEKIFKEIIDPAVGLDFQARKLAYSIAIPSELVNKAVKFMQALYLAFVDKDCSIAEINPLVVTADGNVMALDARLNFDSNSLFRHKDILELLIWTKRMPKKSKRPNLTSATSHLTVTSVVS